MSTTYKLYANTNPLNKNMMVCVLSSDSLMTTNNEEKLRLIKTKYKDLKSKSYGKRLSVERRVSKSEISSPSALVGRKVNYTS